MLQYTFHKISQNILILCTIKTHPRVMVGKRSLGETTQINLILSQMLHGSFLIQFFLKPTSWLKDRPKPLELFLRLTYFGYTLVMSNCKPVKLQTSREGWSRSFNLKYAEEIKRTNYKLLLNIEVTILCVLIIGVWILLSLPILFYHLPMSEVRL